MNDDEQIRLLQQILEVQKEHLAFAKQNSQDFKAMQQTAIAGQQKALRIVRYAIVFGIIAALLLFVLTLLQTNTEDDSGMPPIKINVHNRRAPVESETSP